MKKTIIWVLTLFIIASLCGCRHLSDDTSGSTYSDITTSNVSNTADYSDDNTVSSEAIVSSNSSSNQTSVARSNQTSVKNRQNSGKVKKQTNWSSSEPRTSTGHIHNYIETVVKEAGIGVEGVIKYTCICGDSFTGSIPAKSSLAIPSLPKSVSNYNQSTFDVTNITYKFNDYNFSLDLYFSGKKTYDSNGSENSDYCRIGWKIYGPDGSVVKSGTFYSPKIAVGDSFNNLKEEAISTYDSLRPGAYRLELYDVN